MSTKTVLIVDDDPSMVCILQHKLTQAGFSTIVAQNGKRALSIVNNQHIDLILLDILMPEMNGITFLEEMRKLHLTIPILVITNFSIEENKKRTLSLGAKEYVVKCETSLHDLMEKINSLCENPSRQSS